MRVDSLEELESAFAKWRSGKKHVREPMPEELRARGQRTAKKHGVKAVVRVTGVDRGRLLQTQPVSRPAWTSSANRSPTTSPLPLNTDENPRTPTVVPSINHTRSSRSAWAP